MRQWKPNVTVAAVVERDGRFLLVEEETPAGLRLNQPAGHLEPGESLLHAVSREVLEETAWAFSPQTLVGVYLQPRPEPEVTYLRFAFTGTLGAYFADRRLDHGIVRALWLTPEEIHAAHDRHRSAMVERTLADYLAGCRYPLSLVHLL